MRGSRLLSAVAVWLRAHAAADRHSVTITVAPSQAERTFQLELPRWSLRLLGAILAASLVLILAGGVLYGKLIRDALLLRELRKENRVLREDAVRLQEIESDLAEINRMRRQLYSLAGVPEAEAGASSTAITTDAPPILAEPSGATPGDLSPEAKGTPLCQLPLRGPLSQGFSKTKGGAAEHLGVDIAGRTGTPVAAAADGRISRASWDDTFGNLLVIRHAGGWETIYGHNEAMLVAQGDSVRAGQTVALMGTTGKSSAPHLHFEVRRNGASRDPGIYFPPYNAPRP